MSLPLEFDEHLHHTARQLARARVDHQLAVGSQDNLDQDENQTLARAYIDLVERRGLPAPLKCYPSIQMISGSYFDFAHPENSTIWEEDIAHALARVSRYAGHTLGVRAYTVAQHCVLASLYAPVGFRFEALMHDAAEYVVGDVTTPLKQLCPDYKLIEKRVHHEIAKAFLLPLEISPEVKLVDMRLMATEKRDLMPRDRPGDEWEMLAGFEPYPDQIEVWSTQIARNAWFATFAELWPTHQALQGIG